MEIHTQTIRGNVRQELGLVGEFNDRQGGLSLTIQTQTLKACSRRKSCVNITQGSSSNQYLKVH